MNDPIVYYKRGYRFQAVSRGVFQTPIHEECTSCSWVKLSHDGMLIIMEGYAWDGASGPVPQSVEVIRASLVHDALYQLMREHGLSSTWRDVADKLFHDMLIRDNLHPAMARVFYEAVRVFGARFIYPDAIRPVLLAPMSNESPEINGSPLNP